MHIDSHEKSQRLLCNFTSLITVFILLLRVRSAIVIIGPHIYWLVAQNACNTPRKDCKDREGYSKPQTMPMHFQQSRLVTISIKPSMVNFGNNTLAAISCSHYGSDLDQ